MDGDGFLIGFGLLVGAFVSGMAVNNYSNTQWQAEAAKRGVAEYYLDETNGAAWRWTVEVKGEADDE